MVQYPVYHPTDASYDTYWNSRDMQSLNSFQQERVRFLATQIQSGDSVLDVGCGDGRILEEILRIVPGVRARGIDSSPTALEYAIKRGISVRQADIRDPSSVQEEIVDWVLLLEVLEHMTNSEELLAWAHHHVRRGVIFSVPNTGFLIHRLRLLLGRFPLQWRTHPAEHVRFWTLRDMHYWLTALGYRYEIHPYEGIPLLNRIWPAGAAAGLLVIVLINTK